MKSFMKIGMAAVVCAAVGAGCLSAGQKQTANTVLEVTKYSCIVANAALPVEQIKVACAVADDLIPAIEAVLKDLGTHDAARAAACQGQGSKSAPVGQGSAK